MSEECLLTGDDLCRPHQGDGPPGRLGCQRRDPRQEHQGGQGAGGLFRRNPPHDRKRDVHHQRHGKGHCEPAPSLPGVFFDQDQVKPHTGGKIFYYARIIPYRGSWIDFEFDQKDLLYVRIDRRRKIPVTVLLRALKYTGQELLDYFYHREKILIRKGKFLKEISKDVLVGTEGARPISSTRKPTR